MLQKATVNHVPELAALVNGTHEYGLLKKWPRVAADQKLKARLRIAVTCTK